MILINYNTEIVLWWFLGVIIRITKQKKLMKNHGISIYNFESFSLLVVFIIVSIFLYAGWKPRLSSNCSVLSAMLEIFMILKR